MAIFKVFSGAGIVSLLSIVDYRSSNFGRRSYCTPEKSEERQQDDPDEQAKSANLGTRFARLTNSVLERNSDGKSIDSEAIIEKMYLEYMQGAKTELIGSINKEYKSLQCYYKNPSSKMPAWLSKSPPVMMFFIDKMDMSLQSRLSQIEQDLRSFVEELGFVCTRSGYMDWAYSGREFYLELQLNVPHVPTKRTGENADANLETPMEPAETES